MKRHVRHDCSSAGQRGLTLVELLIFIVVVSIAVTGVLSVMNITTQHGADPMLRKQVLAIAESLLEEILTREYSDPDCSPVQEASRALYDDVDDYDGFTLNGIADMNGAPIAGLEAYSAVVAVASTTLGGVAAKQVNIRVTDPSGVAPLALTGYRTDYLRPCMP